MQPNMGLSATQLAESPPLPPAEPHGALFLVLGYLRLPELFACHRVCRSFRDAVADDRLLWQDLVVEPPLSGKLTDDTLAEVATRAGGKLRTLALVNSWKVTDAGLQRVVDENPSITKLHVPGCTHLTADGVVRAVGCLKDSLKQLRLNGIPNITREHLFTLYSILRVDPHPLPSFYIDWQSPALDINDSRPIDLDVCPKCGSARLVFDCTRGKCRATKGSRWMECRGCFYCIARCGVCGGCVGIQELGEESACSHLLCLECWLQLPKCNMCNRPYCPWHGNSLPERSGSSGFVCEQCQRYEDSFVDEE